MTLRSCFSYSGLTSYLITPKSSPAALLPIVPNLLEAYQTFAAVRERFDFHEQIRIHHFRSSHSYKRSITRKALLAAYLAAS
jgi:hypothetical protein